MECFCTPECSGQKEYRLDPYLYEVYGEEQWKPVCNVEYAKLEGQLIL
ncbi:hypothetical protein SEA_NICEHOUSE_114 [Rhodococcus phage NiceHouse]|nr:hypothetical protein SEA_NICEHOUSE_114 [Rhodococcus phage NiceHouse]